MVSWHVGLASCLAQTFVRLGEAFGRTAASDFTFG